MTGQLEHDRCLVIRGHERAPILAFVQARKRLFGFGKVNRRIIRELRSLQTEDAEEKLAEPNAAGRFQNRSRRQWVKDLNGEIERKCADDCASIDAGCSIHHKGPNAPLTVFKTCDAVLTVDASGSDFLRNTTKNRTEAVSGIQESAVEVPRIVSRQNAPNAS